MASLDRQTARASHGLRPSFPFAQPVLRPMDKLPQYITCVRYSPLDEKNQPAGSETKLAIFLGGRLMQFIPGDPQVCGSLTYQRFPELESLGPAKT